MLVKLVGCVAADEAQCDGGDYDLEAGVGVDAGVVGEQDEREDDAKPEIACLWVFSDDFEDSAVQENETGEDEKVSANDVDDSGNKAAGDDAQSADETCEKSE